MFFREASKKIDFPVNFTREHCVCVFFCVCVRDIKDRKNLKSNKTSSDQRICHPSGSNENTQPETGLTHYSQMNINIYMHINIIICMR